MSPRSTSSSHGSYDSSPPSPWEKASPSENRPTPVRPVTIAVMGATGSGKTSFINLASGSGLRIGMGLESCTAKVQLANQFALDGRPVTLIDTPGFDDTIMSDTDVLKMIAAFLAMTYEKGSKLSGVIYIHRISDKRFTGINGRNFGMFRKLCGDSTLKNVVLVTNMWSAVSPEDGEDRESQLSGDFFKPVLDKGAQMARHYDTTQSAHDIVWKIVENHPVVLGIQKELVDQGKDIVDTAAGEAVSRELNERIGEHQAELKGLRKEMAQALKRKDEEMRQELAEQTRKLQEQMEKIKQASENMASEYAAVKERMEAKIKETVMTTSKEGPKEGCLVTIPIYRASGDETACTGAYLSDCKLSSVRDELMEEANLDNHLRHTYVEVIMKGETEGRFLEDLNAHRWETLDHVSRLVYWTHADIDSEVKNIAHDLDKRVSKAGIAKHFGVLSEAASSLNTMVHVTNSKLATNVISAVTSMANRHAYYQHLLTARDARDALDPESDGIFISSVKFASSIARDYKRIGKSLIAW